MIAGTGVRTEVSEELDFRLDVYRINKYAPIEHFLEIPKLVYFQFDG